MKEAFAGIKKIKYEGPDSKNPLAFKHYNPDQLVEGKTMVEHLRFSVAYWHAFRNGCGDQYGACRSGSAPHVPRESNHHRLEHALRHCLG